METTWVCPQLSESHALNILKETFGIQTVKLSSLPSERDQNWKVTADTGKEYVLKISNKQEKEDLIQLQNKILSLLSKQNVLAPSLIPSLSGDSISTVKDEDSNTLMVRLLSWIPGITLATYSPHSESLLHSIGVYLGKLDSALFGIEDEAANRVLKWDLKESLWIKPFVSYVKDEYKRSIVCKYLDMFEKVLPLLPQLRQSIIHNDANDWNIVISQNEKAEVALIDYGDIQRTNTINELAIATAYSILDKPDPLAACTSIISGYNSVVPLQDIELSVLYTLICTRLCVSVVNSAYQQSLQPDNKYLSISEAPAWNTLFKLIKIHPNFALYSFRSACGKIPVERAPFVIQYLKNEKDNLGSIIRHDMSKENVEVLDLSVGSEFIGILSSLNDVKEFSTKINDSLRHSGAQVAIGRYNECRCIYTSDLFKHQGNNGPEWRTVHLGIDVFTQAGEEIFAPLDSVVHSFSDNEAAQDYGPCIILQHEIETQGERVTFYTLYGHLSRDSLNNLKPGTKIQKGQLVSTSSLDVIDTLKIGRVGMYPENGNWPPHCHFQIILDMFDWVGEFPGVCLPSERDLWMSLCPDPNLILRIQRDCDGKAGVDDRSELLELRHKFIGKNLSISYRNPLSIVRGYKQFLYDSQGQKYLDGVNNVAHCGHCNDKIVKKGQKQMEILNTNTRYLHSKITEYAQQLQKLLPPQLSVFFFVCSGSEANELALRLARAHTQANHFIVIDGAYHGNTMSLIDLSPYKYLGPGGEGQKEHVERVMMPDTYRGPYKRTDPDAGSKYALEVKHAIQNIHKKGQKVAAFVCESILGCGGQLPLPPSYLKEAFQHVRESGGVCIVDEVQTGFGRVGSHFWGFETQGVVPDIVTMGKPMGNGHPIGCVVTTPQIAASFNNGMEYFNTFGGNPVSCAIGSAVLEVIAEEGLQKNALKVGGYLLHQLQLMKERHAIIGDVRGLGLFIGVELVKNVDTLEPAAEVASYVCNRMREHKILISTDGPLHNVLKFKPPLVFNMDDAQHFLFTLDLILKETFVTSALQNS